MDAETHGHSSDAETVLVTGARDWADEALVVATLKRHAPHSAGGVPPTLIHGDCQGLDRLAAKVGAALGFRIEAYPADWARYGRAAGPVRNREMVQRLMRARTRRYVYAFHDSLEKSKGTLDCVRRARAAKLQPQIVSHRATATAAPPARKRERSAAAPSEVSVVLSDAELEAALAEYFDAAA